jgi:hypothetical protein
MKPLDTDNKLKNSNPSYTILCQQSLTWLHDKTNFSTDQGMNVWAAATRQNANSFAINIQFLVTDLGNHGLFHVGEECSRPHFIKAKSVAGE